MDPAFCGSCRSGYCRCGVYDPKFDDVMDQLKNQPAQHRGGIDPAICGDTMRCGFSRCGVYGAFFDEVMQQMKNQPARCGGGLTPCVQGSAKQGTTRQGIKIPVFHEIMQRQKEG